MTPEEIVAVWKDMPGWDRFEVTMIGPTRCRSRCKAGPECLDLWVVADAANLGTLEFIHGDPESEARIQLSVPMSETGRFYDKDVQPRLREWIAQVHTYEAMPRKVSPL